METRPPIRGHLRHTRQLDNFYATGPRAGLVQLSSLLYESAENELPALEIEHQPIQRTKFYKGFPQGIALLIGHSARIALIRRSEISWEVVFLIIHTKATTVETTPMGRPFVKSYLPGGHHIPPERGRKSLKRLSRN
jgi:hypothetical protein